MDSTSIPYVGAVGGCIVAVAGVAVYRYKNYTKSETVGNKALTIETPNPVPQSVIQMSEVNHAIYADMPPLDEIPQVTPTSATSGRSDATSATSVCSNDIGTPYTTLPMGGFRKESLKPMMEVDITAQGGYLLQHEQGVNKESSKMIKAMFQ